MEWHQLRTGQIVPIEGERTNDNYVWLATSIEDRIAQIEARNFARSPSKKCLDCVAQERCERNFLDGIKLELPENPQIELFPVSERKKGFRKHQYKLGID